MVQLRFGWMRIIRVRITAQLERGQQIEESVYDSVLILKGKYLTLLWRLMQEMFIDLSFLSRTQSSSRNLSVPSCPLGVRPRWRPLPASSPGGRYHLSSGPRWWGWGRGGLVCCGGDSEGRPPLWSDSVTMRDLCFCLRLCWGFTSSLGGLLLSFKVSFRPWLYWEKYDEISLLFKSAFSLN